MLHDGTCRLMYNSIAHRLRNMQTLPYTAIKNQHLSHVYELYYSAFEKLRKVSEVRTLEDNDKFCQVIKECLQEHLSVIPRLAMGVLEIQETVPSEECDRLMTALLRSVSCRLHRTIEPS